MSDLDQSSLFNKSAYNQWSEFYDSYPNSTIAMDELVFPTYWKDLTRQKILEVGCGTGRHTLKLVSQGNSVIGIDLSDQMLEKARTRLGEFVGRHIEGQIDGPIGEVLLIEGDILTYPDNGSKTSHHQKSKVALELKQNSFNSIVSALVIEHILDLNLLFSRFAEFLMNDGKVYLSEIHPDRAAKQSLAHFKDPHSGQEVRLASVAHTSKAILASATQAGFSLLAKESILGDERLCQINPEWKRYLNLPMIQIWIFEKTAFKI